MTEKQATQAVTKPRPRNGQVAIRMRRMRRRNYWSAWRPWGVAPCGPLAKPGAACPYYRSPDLCAYYRRIVKNPRGQTAPCQEEILSINAIAGDLVHVGFPSALAQTAASQLLRASRDMKDPKASAEVLKTLNNYCVALLQAEQKNGKSGQDDGHATMVRLQELLKAPSTPDAATSRESACAAPCSFVAEEAHCGGACVHGNAPCRERSAAGPAAASEGEEVSS